MDRNGRDLLFGCGCALLSAAPIVGFLLVFVASAALGSNRSGIPEWLAASISYGVPVLVAGTGIGLIVRGLLARTDR